MNASNTTADCGGFTFFEFSNTILIPSITIVGCLGNGSIAAVYVQSRNRKTCVAYLITALAISNISYLTAASTTFTLIPKVVALGPLLPFAFGVMHTSRTCVVWTYMVLMVDRAIALKWPLKHQVHQTIPKTKLTVLFLVVAAFLFNGTRYAELQATYVQIVVCGSNVTVLHPDVRMLRKDRLYIKIYLSWLCSIFLYVVPFGVIAALNSTIYYLLRKHRFSLDARARDSSQQRRFSVKMMFRDRTSQGSVNLQTGNGDRLSGASSSKARDPSITMMLFVEALVFLACNTMPLCLNIMETLTPEKFDALANLNPVFRHAISLNNILALLNAALTFFVFFAFGSKFRLQFQLLMSKILCGRCAPAPTANRETRSTCHLRNRSYVVNDGESSGVRNGSVQLKNIAGLPPNRQIRHTCIDRRLSERDLHGVYSNMTALICSDV